MQHSLPFPSGWEKLSSLEGRRSRTRAHTRFSDHSLWKLNVVQVAA